MLLPVWSRAWLTRIPDVQKHVPPSLDRDRPSPGVCDRARLARLINERKYQAALRKLRGSRQFSEHEAILFARSLAATPDQRWKLNANFLRSLGCSGLSVKRKLSYR
jgi:hypothetical protein